MPCNSDYLAASGDEVYLSRVACLLDELDGRPFNAAHYRGFHPRVYNNIIDGHAMVRELCDRLKGLDVRQYSLEMQIWWRDHLIADQERIATEARHAQEDAKAKAALDKLTREERILLGLERAEPLMPPGVGAPPIKYRP